MKVESSTCFCQCPVSFPGTEPTLKTTELVLRFKKGKNLLDLVRPRLVRRERMLLAPNSSINDYTSERSEFPFSGGDTLKLQNRRSAVTA